MSDIVLGLQIETPSGWLELEDEAGGYSLHSETRAPSRSPARKKSINSEWVPGTFVTRSVDENVTESVSVWVTGASQFELRTRLQRPAGRAGQLSYQMRFTTGDVRETWECQVADYAIQTDQPMLIATWALVKAQIPRLPNPTIEQVV